MWKNSLRWDEPWESRWAKHLQEGRILGQSPAMVRRSRKTMRWAPHCRSPETVAASTSGKTVWSSTHLWDLMQPDAACQPCTSYLHLQTPRPSCQSAPLWQSRGLECSTGRFGASCAKLERAKWSAKKNYPQGIVLLILVHDPPARELHFWTFKDSRSCEAFVWKGMHFVHDQLDQLFYVLFHCEFKASSNRRLIFQDITSRYWQPSRSPPDLANSGIWPAVQCENILMPCGKSSAESVLWAHHWSASSTFSTSPKSVLSRFVASIVWKLAFWSRSTKLSGTVTTMDIWLSNLQIFWNLKTSKIHCFRKKHNVAVIDVLHTAPGLLYVRPWSRMWSGRQQRSVPFWEVSSSW